ncbi:MAG: hypothetical protein N2254_05300, partial [bacterium]|nr:hypothetical protein [bacterium]
MQSSEEISLSEILHTLKKWKKHIFIFSFLVFAVIFSLQTLPKRGKKIYKATAVIRVTHESSLPLVLSTLNLGVRPIKINLSYEADSIKSDKNLKEAIKILGWSEKDIGKLASMIEVSYSERDNTISVSAYTDDPMRSKEVADAVARAYVGISRQRFEEIIDSSMEYLKASAEDVSKRLRLSYDSLASLVQDTGVVDPRTQIQERVRRIEDIREEIYKTEYKIQMLEKFLMDISRNKEMTRERIGDRNRIFERDGLPMGREAVEVLKGRIGDL